MEERREERDLGTSGTAPPVPVPHSVPPKVPGPIPWSSREPPSKVRPVRGPTSYRGCGAMHPPSPGEASRHPALRLVRHPALRLVGLPLAD
jgi:hypothetical protein